MRCTNTTRDARRCTRESHEFGKCSFEKQNAVAALFDKVLAELSEARFSAGEPFTVSTDDERILRDKIAADCGAYRKQIAIAIRQILKGGK